MYPNRPYQSLGSNELLSRSQRFVFALFFTLLVHSIELTVVHNFSQQGFSLRLNENQSTLASSCKYLRFASWFDTSAHLQDRLSELHLISSLLAEKTSLCYGFTSFIIREKQRTDLQTGPTTRCISLLEDLIRRGQAACVTRREVLTTSTSSFYMISSFYSVERSFCFFFSKITASYNSTPVV